MKLQSFLRLIRPANGITAISDVLAGAIIAGLTINDSLFNLGLLIIATFCLYSGGIVFNDVFDLDIDKLERPERPLPAGKIKLKSAILFGVALNLFGILFSFLTNLLCGGISITIVLTALTYNKFTKKHPLLGPLTMGGCRSLNLLLGISILGKPELIMCLFPLLFIAGITLTSHGEVHGKNKHTLLIALIIDGIITGSLIILNVTKGYSLWSAAPFLCLWFGMNVNAKVAAIRKNRPEIIQNAVKIGVISLIPLNAVYAASYGGWISGCLILGLLPVAKKISKTFAVT